MSEDQEKRAIEDAQKFMYNREHLDICHPCVPNISWSNDGELNFWWDDAEIYVDLGFYGDGTYSLYAKAGDKEWVIDDAPADETLPGEILEYLRG